VAELANTVASLGVASGDTRALALNGFGTRYVIDEPTDRPVSVQGVGFSTRLLALNGFDVRRTRVFAGPARRIAPGRRRERDEEALLFMLLR
jgi:hypothetical protein